jgi:DNA-binding FadR family transcriptional regulator
MGAAGSRIPKASDLVVSSIRNKILFERLPVGTRLPSEVELMEENGLGRVTVREALRILERQGLVEVRRGPSGGIFVRHADIRQVSEALALLFSLRDTTLGEFADFRQLVEPRVAYLAAVNASDEQRAALVRAAESEQDTARTADMHSLIADACGNDVFEFVVKSMHSSLAGHFRYDHITPENRAETALAHLKIAAAIAAGDARGAEKAMHRHIETYGLYLREHGLDTEPIVPRDRG